jgi:flagellar protein FlbD
MIQLTRLNQKAFIVNADLIKFVESTPDTLITLVSGEKLVVLESAETVVARVVEFRRKVLDGLLINGLSSPDGPLRIHQESPSERRHHNDDPDEKR